MFELTPSMINGILFLFAIGISALILFVICYFKEEKIKGCKRCIKYNHNLHICQDKLEPEKMISH